MILTLICIAVNLWSLNNGIKNYRYHKETGQSTRGDLIWIVLPVVLTLMMVYSYLSR